MDAQVKEDNILCIAGLDGKKIIATVKNIFFYVDPNFFPWGLAKNGVATEEINVCIIEVSGEKSFIKIFEAVPGKWSQRVLSQNQIVEFCEKMSGKIKEVGNNFMFICKIDENKSINEDNPAENAVLITVRVFSDGLRVYVHRLNDVNVWHGKVASYVVVPV